MDDEKKYRGPENVFIRWLGRTLVMTIVLAIVSWVTPGFTIRGLWNYVIAAVVISVIDYLAEKLIKVNASPFSKGIKGFTIAALILYVSQFIVPNMSVTILGAIIGAIVIGILDAIFPTRVM